MDEKIPLYRAASKAFQSTVASSLMEEIDDLEKKLRDIEFILNGDRTTRALDLDGDYSLLSRARNAAFDNMRATTNITGTAKRNYELAAEEFAPILEEVKKLKAEFDAFDQRLNDMDAPLIPGQLPRWEKK